jgi:hypothetical protein
LSKDIVVHYILVEDKIMSTRRVWKTYMSSFWRFLQMKGGRDDGAFGGDVGTNDKHMVDPLDGVLPGQVLISLTGGFARP